MNIVILYRTNLDKNIFTSGKHLTKQQYAKYSKLIKNDDGTTHRFDKETVAKYAIDNGLWYTFDLHSLANVIYSHRVELNLTSEEDVLRASVYIINNTSADIIYCIVTSFSKGM